MLIRNADEGVRIALDSLRSNKLRAGLTILGRRLSDQGHARVGAQVCDAVLAWEGRPR